MEAFSLNRKRLFQGASSLLTLVFIASLFMNFNYHNQIQHKAQRENLYVQSMYGQFTYYISSAALSLRYTNYPNNGSLDYQRASADIAAAASQLRALAQYEQMVQQQSSALFPSAKGRVANYLSIVALSLINKSPVYIVEGTKYTFSKQSGKTFILKINSILMGNKNNNAKENEMSAEFSQIYNLIPSYIRTKLGSTVLTFGNL